MTIAVQTSDLAQAPLAVSVVGSQIIARTKISFVSVVVKLGLFSPGDGSLGLSVDSALAAGLDLFGIVHKKAIAAIMDALVTYGLVWKVNGVVRFRLRPLSTGSPASSSASISDSTILLTIENL